MADFTEEMCTVCEIFPVLSLIGSDMSMIQDKTVRFGKTADARIRDVRMTEKTAKERGAL